MGGLSDLKPIISKLFCSPNSTTLMVRKRPNVVHGGGFVVTNCAQKAVFTVDGCGVLGTKGELVVRDGNGASILFIHKKRGLVQVLSAHNQWKSYTMDCEGPSKLAFSLSEPKSCVAKKNVFGIYIEPKGNHKDCDFEVIGSFLDRACTIVDRRGTVVAQMGFKESMGSKDLYHVVVQPGYDQAFVVGVIAILDNIYGESTRC